MNKMISHIRNVKALLNVRGLPQFFLMLKGNLLKILIPEQ